MATSKKASPTSATQAEPAAVTPVAAKPKLAAVPVAKKAAVKAVAKAKPKAAGKEAGKVEGPAIDQAQRANYIEVAAYYIAQRRGFTPGDPEQDYLNAAAEVDQLIAAGHFSK